jgi:hypothetical protein
MVDVDEMRESVKPLTSNLYVISVILRRQNKQWLREIPDVALEMASGYPTFARAEMAHHEKHCDGIYVVCILERK